MNYHARSYLEVNMGLGILDMLLILVIATLVFGWRNLLDLPRAIGVQFLSLADVISAEQTMVVTAVVFVWLIVGYYCFGKRG